MISSLPNCQRQDFQTNRRTLIFSAWSLFKAWPRPALLLECWWMARNVKWSRELTFHGGTSHLCGAVRLGEPAAVTSGCLILSLAAVVDVAG